MVLCAGRVDDVINVSGHRIGTAEVESALVNHPACAEAAVVPVEHTIKGQGIYAFITLMDVRCYPHCLLLPVPPSSVFNKMYFPSDIFTLLVRNATCIYTLYLPEDWICSVCQPLLLDNLFTEGKLEPLSFGVWQDVM